MDEESIFHHHPEPEPAWAKALAEQLKTVISNQETIQKLMSSSNISITQLVADFAAYQAAQTKVNADTAAFVADSQTFYAAVIAFIASVKTGSGGTVLSAADQALLNTLDQQVQTLTPAATALDSSVENSDAALKAITVPVPPAPSA
jgi:DNA gyrase/topoisomerase IV subunit B